MLQAMPILLRKMIKEAKWHGLTVKGTGEEKYSRCGPLCPMPSFKNCKIENRRKDLLVHPISTLVSLYFPEEMFEGETPISL